MNISRKQIKFLSLAISLLILIFFTVSFIYRDEFILMITSGIEAAGILTVFVLTVIMEIVPQYISPHVILISAVVLGMNIYYVLGALLLGSIMGSLIGYELGRVYGAELVERMVGAKSMEKTNYFINTYGAAIIFVASFSPVPYLPIVFGSLNLKRKIFLLFGLFPRIIGYTIFTFLITLI